MDWAEHASHMHRLRSNGMQCVSGVRCAHFIAATTHVAVAARKDADRLAAKMECGCGAPAAAAGGEAVAPGAVGLADLHEPLAALAGAKIHLQVFKRFVIEWQSIASAYSAVTMSVQASKAQKISQQAKGRTCCAQV